MIQRINQELKEASDDKVKDDDAANLGVEPKTAPKSQTQSKPKNKPIPESKPQPEAGETGYLPACFGNYICARCDIEFPYKNPLNSHTLNKQASFPCERCNRKARYKNRFDKHMIGHKKRRKYNYTNCQFLVKIKQPNKKHELAIQADWNDNVENKNHPDENQPEDLQALQPHDQEEDDHEETTVEILQTKELLNGKILKSRSQILVTTLP